MESAIEEGVTKAWDIVDYGKLSLTHGLKAWWIPTQITISLEIFLTPTGCPFDFPGLSVHELKSYYI